MARGGAMKNGESVSGYFRKVFEDNPKLLGRGSNDALYERWMADHPEATEVPKQVKQGLANIKSILRSKGRKGRGPAKSVTKEGKSTVNVRGLETLEEHIDESLSVAKELDREGLENVIKLLRRARNEVVMKIGQ